MRLGVQRRKSLAAAKVSCSLPPPVRVTLNAAASRAPHLRLSLYPYGTKTRPRANGPGSMLTRRNVVIGAASVAIASHAVAADVSAGAFVTAIYDTYVGKKGNGVTLDSDQNVRHYFAPSLAALILKDQSLAARRKEVGTLDFDPFVDAQDWDIAAFDVAVSDKGPDKANATVNFNNFGNPKTVVLDLVRIRNEWKIGDIAWTPHENPNTLRALYVHQ
jgi:hypothetical protein